MIGVQLLTSSKPMYAFGFRTSPLTTMESACVAVAPNASVTRTVKFDVPAVVGLPEMTPAADRVSPAGSEPDASDQVSGPVPPVATSPTL